MCIITAEELEAERQHWLKVTKTNIFARHTRPGYQAITYSLSIASKSAAAMILPLPVSPGRGENALTFINLSGYEDFFKDLSVACEPEVIAPEFLDLLGDDLELGAAPAAAQLLTVHEVGDFEASYVPTMADFTRLDPRFRLSDEIWQKMPDYSNYGFAVFQLKLTLVDDFSETENTIHPMAFEFPTRDSDHLYFPTVHVHDGDYHGDAGFYHTFYCQRDNARAEFKYQRDLLEGKQPSPPEDFNDSSGFDGYYWYYRSGKPASEVMAIDQCEGLLDPEKKLYSMTLHGNYPNKDIWLGESL